MFEIENSIMIDRSREDVFEFVSEPGNSPRWQKSTESAEWTSEEPIGKGSSWRTLVRFMGREAESTLELTDWEPPSRMSFRVADGPVPMEATFRFEAVNGGTRLSAFSKLDAVGFFKIAEGLLKRQVQKQHDSDLGRLKELLENGS